MKIQRFARSQSDNCFDSLCRNWFMRSLREPEKARPTLYELNCKQNRAISLHYLLYVIGQSASCDV